MGVIRMSDIQRWHLNGLPGTAGMVEVMLYADHVAAVAAADATLKRAENAWREEIRTRLTEQYEAGVKAARDAVAALPKHNMNVGSYIAAPPLLVINRKQALAAIDAINEGKYLI